MLTFGILLYFNQHIYIIGLFVGIYGAHVCNCVPIVFEEFLAMLESRYLLTGAVTIRIAGSLYAVLLTYALGAFLTKKTQEKGMICAAYFSFTYIISALISLSAMNSAKKSKKVKSEAN